MTETDQARKRLRDLFDNQQLAVLSTHKDGKAYASLVAFTATEDLRELLFATARSTRKFDNLTAKPHVAMLIDSRTNSTADFHEAVAVTATGTAEEVPEDERQALQAQYLQKHPYMADFVTAPTCA
ncbi:MAG: pyridoxamine 5'-phosphate oxidase family protein, partial [Thermodesulfobacteriota bacterium]